MFVLVGFGDYNRSDPHVEAVSESTDKLEERGNSIYEGQLRWEGGDTYRYGYCDEIEHGVLVFEITEAEVV